MKTKVPLTSGVKYDGEKPRFELMPPMASLEVAKVLTYGAKKYSAENWRMVDNAKERYLGAAYRHLNQYHSGEPLDSETGLEHLAHAICSLMFILELRLREGSGPKATP